MPQTVFYAFTTAQSVVHGPNDERQMLGHYFMDLVAGHLGVFISGIGPLTLGRASLLTVEDSGASH